MQVKRPVKSKYGNPMQGTVKLLTLRNAAGLCDSEGSDIAVDVEMLEFKGVVKSQFVIATTAASRIEFRDRSVNSNLAYGWRKEISKEVFHDGNCEGHVFVWKYWQIKPPSVQFPSSGARRGNNLTKLYPNISRRVIELSQLCEALLDLAKTVHFDA